MRWTVKLDAGAHWQLGCAPADLHKWELAGRRQVLLRLGSRCCPVDLTPDPGLAPGQLRVGAAAANRLLLPAGVPWCICIRGREIVLGPVVGILAARRTAELSGRKASQLDHYVREYDRVGGLICLFAVDGFDPASASVQGLYYRPGTGGGRWVAGRFPYPGAVFVHRRKPESRSVCWHLTGVLGDRVFNADPFNKWDGWQWLWTDPSLRRHLPETRSLRSGTDLLQMLDAYGTVYVKAWEGNQGRKVIQAERHGAEIVLRRRRRSRNLERRLQPGEALERWCRTLSPPDRWLVQQSVPLARLGDRPVDFRVIVQRVPGGRWVVPGVVGRVAAPGSVVTNTKAGGKARPGWRLLRRLLGRAGGRRMRNRMEELAIAAAGALDRCGLHYANLGIDIGMTPAGRLWILEVNNVFPEHDILLVAGDRTAYRRTMTNLVAYAAWLTGF